MSYRDDPQVQTMIRNMPEKTGKSLDEWFGVLRASAFEKHGQMMKLLKEHHGVGHGFANTICQIYRQETSEVAAPTDQDLVEAQYAKKDSLRPIYEALRAAALALGADVTVAPKKRNVSLRRAKQFALIQPTTKTRVDLGVQLKGVPPQGRLEDGKMWGGMCTHRIKLNGTEDMDGEVLGWLAQAYKAAG